MAATWLQSFAERNDSVCRKVLQDLIEAGVSVRIGVEESGGPGALVFEAVTDSLLAHLREISQNGVERIIAVTPYASVLGNGVSWRLLKAGASDVVAWDGSSNPGAQIAARLDRWEEVDRLVLSPLVQENLIGRSPAWLSTLRQIVEIARFNDASVLITGESGTGKELVARLIHSLDQRPGKRDLVILDCTTVVPELSGSEFFGHERGSFTGAVNNRIGAFALADGGTLFLDEVGELPLRMQAELMRVVQERTYKPLGSNTWRATGFRLICATNRDLFDAGRDGGFRSDFYYRIANWTCKLPPLRQRTEDILPLARHFLKKARPQQEAPYFDESVRGYLLSRPYPGNVRDLKHLVHRMSYRHVGPGPITIGDIPEEERSAFDGEPVDWRSQEFEAAIRIALAQGVGLKEIGRTAEDIAVNIVVNDENGNLQRAASRLGVTDRALQMRRAAHGRRGTGPRPSI